MNLPKLSECRSCHEPIRFVRMPSGRAMPVNPAPTNRVDMGNVVARVVAGSLEGYVISLDRGPSPAYSLRFTPHYATCSERKPAAKPAPPPDAPLF